MIRLYLLDIEVWGQSHLQQKDLSFTIVIFDPYQRNHSLGPAVRPVLYGYVMIWCFTKEVHRRSAIFSCSQLGHSFFGPLLHHNSTWVRQGTDCAFQLNRHFILEGFAQKSFSSLIVYSYLSFLIWNNAMNVKDQREFSISFLHFGTVLQFFSQSLLAGGTSVEFGLCNQDQWVNAYFLRILNINILYFV